MTIDPAAVDELVNAHWGDDITRSLRLIKIDEHDLLGGPSIEDADIRSIASGEH